MAGTAQGHAPKVTTVLFNTSDGVRLRGVLHETGSRQAAVLVGHGFTGGIDRPRTRHIVARLARQVSVLAVDFRGHGRSGGGSTVGGDETLDFDAGVALLRARGYQRIGTLGFSMGASVAVRHAALGAFAPDAVAAVSGPTRWWARDTTPMRRVNLLLEMPPVRALDRLVGVRLGREWGYHPPEPAVAVVDRLAPELPLLIMHGDADSYFPLEHALALHAAAPQAQLWVEPGMAHAESGMTPRRVDRLAAWLLAATGADGPRR